MLAQNNTQQDQHGVLVGEQPTTGVTAARSAGRGGLRSREAHDNDRRSNA